MSSAIIIGRQTSLQNEPWRLSTAVVISAIIHALLLSVALGGQTFGIPAFKFPWQERYLGANDMHIMLLPMKATEPDDSPPALAPPVMQRSVDTPTVVSKVASTTMPPPAANALPAPLPLPSPIPAPSPEAIMPAAKKPDIPLPTTPAAPPIVLPSVSDIRLKQLEQEARERTAIEQVRLEQEKQTAEKLRQSELIAEAQREATRQEQQRIEVARLETERQALARQELERAEMARVEAARKEVVKQEQAKLDAARLEQLRQEAARAEQAARDEASRQLAERQAKAAQEERARQDTARQVAERAEAARKEAQRQEQARHAQLEAARQTQQLEAARQDAIKQEAIRQEAAKQAARLEQAKLDLALQEKAKQEAEREERLRAIGRQLNEEAAQRDAAKNPSRSLLPGVSGLRRGWLLGRADPNADLVQYAEAMGKKFELNMAFDMLREVVKQRHTPPMVTVAIRADGSVEKVTFVVSSGVPAIDDAIRKVVSHHAPYGAFPPALARQYDVIEIRRTWVFDTAIRLQ